MKISNVVKFGFRCENCGEVIFLEIAHNKYNSTEATMIEAMYYEYIKEKSMYRKCPKCNILTLQTLISISGIATETTDYKWNL